MTKPTKTDDLADSTSAAALVAATPTVDDVRKAKQDDLTAANQVVSDRKDAVAAAEAALESARAEADLYAQALATGMPKTRPRFAAMRSMSLPASPRSTSCARRTRRPSPKSRLLALSISRRAGIAPNATPSKRSGRKVRLGSWSLTRSALS